MVDYPLGHRSNLFPLLIYLKEQQPKYFVLAVVLYLKIQDIKILHFLVYVGMGLHRGYSSFLS